VMLVFHPGWQCRASNACVDVEVSGNRLKVDPATTSDIALLRRLDAQYAPNGESFLVAPLWPAAYPLLARRSPMWEIYPILPRSEAFEMEEIKRIKASKPSFVLIFDYPLDRREDLRFRNTHPLIHQYILDSFVPVPYSINPAYQIYKAKDAR
jgi:hypothetical protein